jgi:antitoxin ParD1/3/4
MASQAHKPVLVTLGALADDVEARVTAGHYSSASAVVREGLRALAREETREHEALKARVARALADPRPKIPHDQVFATLRAHIARRRDET